MNSLPPYSFSPRSLTRYSVSRVRQKLLPHPTLWQVELLLWVQTLWLQQAHLLWTLLWLAELPLWTPLWLRWAVHQHPMQAVHQHPMRGPFPVQKVWHLPLRVHPLPEETRSISETMT